MCLRLCAFVGTNRDVIRTFVMQAIIKSSRKNIDGLEISFEAVNQKKDRLKAMYKLRGMRFVF